MTLDKEASSVTHFRFVEERSSAISTGLQTLMQVMADYLYEDADVKSAAGGRVSEGTWQLSWH